MATVPENLGGVCSDGFHLIMGDAVHSFVSRAVKEFGFLDWAIPACPLLEPLPSPVDREPGRIFSASAHFGQGAERGTTESGRWGWRPGVRPSPGVWGFLPLPLQNLHAVQ